MPVWLSLLLAVFATGGFFAALYGLVIVLVEGRRAKAKPRFGIAPGEAPGTVSVWMAWEPEQFALQVYRVRVSHASPDSEVKEGTFTVSYDPPQTEPFIQSIELPATFRTLLERDSGENALFTFEFKTVEELTVSASYSLARAKKIYLGKAGRAPKIANRLKMASADPATIFSLDYSEIQIRKKKIKDLEAAAKAKAAAKPAAKPAAASAPAAAAKPAATPVAAPAAVPTAPAAVPAPAAKPAAPAPTAKPEQTSAPSDVKSSVTKSVRDVVSASNAKQAEKSTVKTEIGAAVSDKPVVQKP